MMTVGLLGKKIGMTQIFDAEGLALPVTVVRLGENVVISKRSKETNGYEALQVGGFAVKEKTLNKAELGVLKKANASPLAPLREFRVDDASSFTVGQPLTVEEVIKEGMLVDVRGKSIGKGFQGTIKKYHHGRGPMSHGSKFHRSMGSIGPGTTPGRVFKGLHMPGQMGNKAVCVRHLQVVKIDLEKKLVLLKGAVPGCDGGIVQINPSKTKWN
jgi:large subunit ribosomal protein L3